MKLHTTCLITILSIVITGCSISSSSLVGTYAVEERGQLRELIRIEKVGDKFTLSEKQSGGWLPPVEITPVSKASLEQFLKEPLTADFTALGNKNVAIVKVPKAWRSGKFESKTGIWLATFLGPIDLQKQ